MAIILTSQLMIVLDASVIITALPKIRDAFGFSPTGLSWVQNAYTLAFGGLLLFGARVGDILGRRRVYMGGIAAFTHRCSAGLRLPARCCSPPAPFKEWPRPSPRRRRSRC
jgi:MFS family permease